MATIEKRGEKNGIPTYRITLALGMDSSGKQVRARRTWKPDKPDMSPRQIEKALARAVADFEREIEQGYQLDHKQKFADYAAYVLDLKSRTGVKPLTIERYHSLLERVNRAIGHMKLADIRPQHLNAFYQNLREDGQRIGNQKATARMDIEKWIVARGLNVTKFAKAAGMARATVATAVAGDCVNRNTAERVAEAMGLPFGDVFTLKKDTSPLSDKTVLEHHRLISTILAQAEKEMLIPFNPAAKATPPKATRKAPDYYQQEEIHAILDALESAPLKWRAITYLLIDTGCRRGEVAGLKWESVNLDEGIITVERALLYGAATGVFESTTKTGETRVLRIAPETLALLRAWKAEQNVMRNAYDDGWTETGYVFTRDNGECINPDGITNWLGKFSKANNLPHIHPHAFRHTAASLMIANGVDIVTAAGELGHANATTTATIYAHQIAEAKAKAENVRAGIFKKK